MNTNALYEKYGRPGDPIPGSRFVRAYCCWCSEPIRVPAMADADEQECAECNPELRGVPGVGESRRTDIDGGPMWDNIVKAYEDRGDENPWKRREKR